MKANTSSSEEIYWNTTLHPTLIVLSVIIVLVNLPVIIVYFKITSLRRSAGNTFLVALAIADILCACVMIPAGLVCDTQVLGENHHRTVCPIYWICGHTISLASIYLIVAATVAKYLAIVHPMRNITACTTVRINFIIIIIWIGSFLVSHIIAYLPSMNERKRFEVLHGHAMLLIVVAFVIPACILIIVHVHIYVRLLLNTNPQGLIKVTSIRSENNSRIAAIFFLLFLFFVVSWLPWELSWARLIEPDQITHDVLAIIRFLAPVLNPVMFTFIKRDFRKAALSLVNGVCVRRKKFYRRQQSSNTQATCSGDRTNFIETQNIDNPHCEPREDKVLNEASQMSCDLDPGSIKPV